MNDFGNYLYTLRKAKGYTQAELADKLGVTNKAVSKWETGEAFPETAQLVPLADIFGVTTDELLRGRSAQCAIPPQENETPPADSAEEIARKYQPDWWHKKFAALIVCGFASIAAGVISVIAAGLLTETEWVHIAVTCALMALIGIGVDLFIYAGVASEYAFLPVKDGAWKSQLGAFIRRLLAGMSFVMLGVIGIVSCGLFEEGALLPSRAAFVGVILAGFACLAVGVFFFIYGGVVWDGYRKKVVSRSMKRADRFLTDEEKEDINAVLEERDALRAIAREDEQDNSLAGKLSSVIMVLATVAFLLLGFLGGLWHPGWVVFPVGGILCAVVGVIFKKDR